MPNPYLPHAVYSVAIISLSIHLSNQKRLASEQRSRFAAQTSILETLAQDLRSDGPVSEIEIERLKRLARRLDVNISNDGRDDPYVEPMGWKEMFLGRKQESTLEEKRNL